VQLYKGTFNPPVSEQQFPVILIHSVMGDPAADYRHLIAHWQHAMGNRALFGLRSPSLDEPGYAVSSIEELAFDYINYLTESLAGYQGPLIFMGYSAGGTIAYEMARQLQFSKRAVAVYCIDTPSVAYYRGLSSEHYATEIFELMQHAGARVMGLDANHGISLTTLQQFTKQEQLTIYWRQLVEKCAHLPKGQRQKIQGIYATLHNAIPGQLDYELKPIKNVNLLAFSDTQLKKCRGDTSLGWGEQLSINTITLAGKHLDLVDQSLWVKEEIMPCLQTFCEQARISLINMQSTLSMLPTLRALKDQILRQYSTLKFSSPKRISVREGYVPAQLKEHGKTVVVNRLDHLFSSDRNPILLVGDNGSGKTGILKFIKSQWAGEKGLERAFTLILEPKLQHFSNKRFKTMSAIEFQLEMVLKTSFSSHYQFHEDIKKEGKLLNLLRLIEKDVLILLDNYEKITNDSYTTLQRIIKYLIKKTAFQILLTSSVHAAPHYFFKTPHSIFTVEPWTDQQRRLFARQHYDNAVEKQVIIESEFSHFLNNPSYLRLYCDHFRGPQLHSKDPRSSNLVYFLEKLELFQWLRYLKKSKVNFDSNKLNILSLTTFRKICETEFEFIKKQAKKCLSKEALLFDDLYLDSLDRTSLSLNSRSATDDDPLQGVVRTGFIKALVLEGQPSNQYQFQNILFRDYFYALSWVDNYTSTIEEDRNNARHELGAHLYNPSYKIIWSLVTGLLAKSEHKDHFKPFIDQIFSDQVFGYYPYLLQAACLQEAKMALSVYYDNSVKQMAQLLKNQMARLDGDHLAIKAESSLIIQLFRQYPFFLNEPAIADVLKKDGRLNHSSQLIELCKEKDEKEKSISPSIPSDKKEMKDLPTDKKSIVNLLKSNNDLSSYFYSFKDNCLIEIMKKTKSIPVLTRACDFISRSCCESNQKTMNLLLDEIKNQHQIRINKKTSTFSYDRGLSKRERQLYLILESYDDEKAHDKDINKLIGKIITSVNDRPSNILFLSLIDYSEYLDTLDLNPLEPEEIPIVFRSTANPLFNLFKKFVNNNEMLLKLVPLIVEYLEKGLTLYFQEDKSLVLMDGERKEVYVVQRPEQIKNSISDLYNCKSLGIDVLRNEIKADKDYQQAAEQGHAKAKQASKILSKQMKSNSPLGTAVNFFKAQSENSEDENTEKKLLNSLGAV
nr:NACHT domain-containing protein [Tatlockia sp.]